MAAEPTTVTGVRARARAEVRAAILAAASKRVAEDGANDLSLRAVARDVGMVSSAVYRYFASRDELLTALIVEAYDSLGDHVEVQVEVPTRLNSDQQAKLREFSGSIGDHNSPMQESFFEKAKRFFGS